MNEDVSEFLIILRMSVAINNSPVLFQRLI